MNDRIVMNRLPIRVTAHKGTLSQNPHSSIDLIIESGKTISLVDADLVPIPLVTSVSASVVNADSAILEWETDIESDGYVEYGINELYGTYSYVTDQQTIMHRVQLMGLQSNTTYHFRIVASRHNIEASQSISKDYVFTTL